jgi:hypothetical protein
MRCPNEHCNFAFQWSSTADSVPFLCMLCGKNYCLNCKVSGGEGKVGPGHHPLSCSQQQQKLEQDAEAKRLYDVWRVENSRAQELYEQAVRENGWKRCPSCLTAIDRNEGCDHMTCKCGCHFCYVCGKYDSSNPKSGRGHCGSRCSSRG